MPRGRSLPEGEVRPCGRRSFSGRSDGRWAVEDGRGDDGDAGPPAGRGEVTVGSGRAVAAGSGLAALAVDAGAADEAGGGATGTATGIAGTAAGIAGTAAARVAGFSFGSTTTGALAFASASRSCAALRARARASCSPADSVDPAAGLRTVSALAGTSAAGGRCSTTVGAAMGFSATASGPASLRVFLRSTTTALERPWLKFCRTCPDSTVR